MLWHLNVLQINNQAERPNHHFLAQYLWWEYLKFTLWVIIKYVELIDKCVHLCANKSREKLNHSFTENGICTVSFPLPLISGNCHSWVSMCQFHMYVKTHSVWQTDVECFWEMLSSKVVGAKGNSIFSCYWKYVKLLINIYLLHILFSVWLLSTHPLISYSSSPGVGHHNIFPIMSTGIVEVFYVVDISWAQNTLPLIRHFCLLTLKNALFLYVPQALCVGPVDISLMVGYPIETYSINLLCCESLWLIEVSFNFMFEKLFYNFYSAINHLGIVWFKYLSMYTGWL